MAREISLRHRKHERAVIPECLYRETSDVGLRGFPTAAFGNDGHCAPQQVKGGFPTEAFGNDDVCARRGLTAWFPTEGRTGRLLRRAMANGWAQTEINRDRPGGNRGYQGAAVFNLRFRTLWYIGAEQDYRCFSDGDGAKSCS